jgi:formiminoglutamate deiminase
VPVSYWAEYAWLPTGVQQGVRIDVADGRFAAIARTPREGATVLKGLTLPGLANVHSHAFHRALRGRTHTGRGTFWTWRDRMYDLAGRLDPDEYHALARATYAEMALAGITCVGEFHYLHHAPGGARYSDPNEMGHRLLAAAAEAGVRITLLDTLYLTATVDGAPLSGPQRRFGDGDVSAWEARVAGLKPQKHARIGAAAHSVRAVPDGQLKAMAATERIRHVHLSEQRAENEACLARYGKTPTQLLDNCGFLTDTTTVVHATHLTGDDRRRLGQHNAYTCFCPTTERDLADGIGPARALAEAGARLCLGSDSQAVIDLFEEARSVEFHERLRDEQRGHFTVDELLVAATGMGHAALDWTDAGVIEPGARADLVTVRLDTVRSAGHEDPAAAVVFAGIAGDVTDVLVDGRPIVHKGRHLLIGDVPGALEHAIAAVWR